MEMNEDIPLFGYDVILNQPTVDQKLCIGILENNKFL